MADDEDDVVFDRAGLLDNRIKATQDIHGAHGEKIRHKVPKTLLLCIAFLGIGMCIAIPGPTLTYLQQKVHGSIESISFIYFARALGYLAGSIFGGMLFDWLNQQMVIGFAMIITSITTICIPFSQTYSLMNCFIGLQGLSMGIVDTGGNALLIYTWGRKTGPYMQALHFSFGLGAFIAPLIAAPFLAVSVPIMSSINETGLNVTNFTVLSPETIPLNVSARSLRHQRDLYINSINLPRVESPNWGNGEAAFVRTKREAPKKPHTGTHKTNDPDAKGLQDMKKETEKRTQENSETPAPKDTGNGTLVNGTTKPPPPNPTKPAAVSPVENVTELPVPSPTTGPKNVTTILKKIGRLDLDRSEFAYVTISAFMFFISLLFWFSCCRDNCTILAMRSREAVELMHKESRSFKLQILAFIFCFYFCYKGLEITFGQFIPTFVKNRFGWSEEKGAFVVALFWGMFALTRALSICFAKCIGPTMMLIFDLVLSTIALLVLLIGLKNPASNQELVIWSSSALFGMGLASMLPTGFTWAERYMEITGKTTSVFIVGSALGEMTVPLITGYFMEHEKESKNGMSMVYVLFTCCLLCAIVFIILQNMASRQGERSPQTRRSAAAASRGDASRLEDRLEMEPIRAENGARKKVTFSIARESVPPRTTLKRLVGSEKGD